MEIDMPGILDNKKKEEYAGILAGFDIPRAEDIQMSVKRKDVIKHLEANGCTFTQGTKHDRWKNPSTGGSAGFSYKKDYDVNYVRDMCDQLGIPRLR